ncbi:AbrB/MazE/SpoVT family DNA-binding domain-containing protein [Maribacter polysaccharolyticus]|uniref:AbrB/MazE/SpoVT family DNA-binding domain-containing protein n=1 Tax=Maribacter polysaccharolyticus TaxID=3020831 RepID=UPI00237F70C4|nr:AbrB/MazE/SpoVT family DNA-binding domain-containing protein [Maribacter polysaccharolyticus]MDE3743996.1 AbrB/MazE/SpoVT family DNA-binding domain-containing protein [Maribacter polysaccharolyticus]
MEANIIKVGNSKGIIIPSKFLKLIGLSNKVSIDVKDNKLIIGPVEKNIRQNWNTLFAKANSKDDRDILIPDVFEDESFEDWTW